MGTRTWNVGSSHKESLKFLVILTKYLDDPITETGGKLRQKGGYQHAGTVTKKAIAHNWSGIAQTVRHQLGKEIRKRQWK